ncbi:MAG: biotin/lipoyl-containing protein [Steroidobacteraceae bacterium]
MATTLRIPKAAVSMREGTLVAWLVPNGAIVGEGDPLYTLELEKSTMDVESPAAGMIRQTGVAGTKYKVGEIIGEIGEAQSAAIVTAMFGSLQRVVQVVPELESAMQAWATDTGAGPFFVFSKIAFTAYEHRGLTALPSLSIATGFSGEVLIELVQLHDDTPSPWRELGVGTLAPALIVNDLDAALATQLESGRACITRGTYGFGARFAFVETPASTGRALQLIEKHFVLMQLTSAMREASTNWDRTSLTATLK